MKPIWIKKSGTTIIGERFSESTDCAIYIDQPLEDITIEHCVFSFCGYALLVNAPVKNLVFKHCNAYMLEGDGVCINTTQGTSENVWIHNNYLHAPFAATTNRGFGVSMRNTKNSYIIENTMVNSKWQGIHLENHCDNIWINKNIVDGIIGAKFMDHDPWKSGMSGVWIADSKNIWLIDNLIQNCETSGVYCAKNNKTILISDNRFFNPGPAGVRVHNNIADANIHIGKSGQFGRNQFKGCWQDIHVTGLTGGVEIKQ